MLRRTSAYFRGRSSIAVVQETRGTGLEVINYALAVPFLFTGLRNLFFCDYAAPFEGEAARNLVDNFWPECRNNKYQQTVAGIAGMLGILVAAMRIYSAMAVHVADFYFASAWLSACDVLLLFIMVRHGLNEFGIYTFLVAIFVAYEIYIGIIARKAHVARLKMTKTRASIMMNISEDEDDKLK